MKRALAVLAALVLIVGAVAVRRAIDDGGADDGEPSVGRSTVILCASELETVCRAVIDDRTELIVEDPGITASRLIELADGVDAGFDVWLTPSPWPAIVEDTRNRVARAPVLGGLGEPLAVTAVVAVSPSDRFAALESVCGGAVDGICLAAQVGAAWDDLGGSSSWGQVRPGLADPARATAGLVGLRAVVASLAGREDFARNDIETDAVLTAIEDLAAVGNNTTTGGSPLDLLLRIGPGTYDVALDLGAVARPAVAARAGGAPLTIADGPVTVDVVAVAPAGEEVDLDLDGVVGSLLDSGWVPAGPDTAATRLNPGVYVALQQTWADAL